MGEADRFSLEALRHIHKQLDDDNDGGIEVNESVEVSCENVRLQFRCDTQVSAGTFSGGFQPGVRAFCRGHKRNM